MKSFLTLSSFALAAALVPGFVSCISDDSTGVTRALSTLSTDHTLENTYNADNWDTLRLTAPDMKQAHAEKPLAYEWQVDGKVVSRTKDLSYVCKDYGTFLCRLKVSNEDAAYFKEFRLNVRYAYRDGLYALAEDADSTVLTYVPLDERQPERDIFARNNPGYKLAAAPQSLTVTRARGRGYLFVSVGEPSRIYKLDGNTMNVIGYAEGTKTSTYLYPSYSGRVNNATVGSTIYVVEDGRFCSVSNTTLSVLLTNTNYQSMNTVLPNARLASQAVAWTRRADEYYNGTAFYDNAGTRFVAYASSERGARNQYRNLFPDDFAGLRLIGMGSVDNRHEIAMLLKDTLTSAYYHVWVDPGAYDVNSKRNNADPELKYKGAVPATAGVKDDTQVVGIPSTNLMYYSSDNALYAYSVLSKGNFPTAPTLLCDAGEKITSLVVSDDDRYLYAAANNTTAKTGSIYCFDLTTRSRVWKKANVSGIIKQLVLRK